MFTNNMVTMQKMQFTGDGQSFVNAAGTTANCYSEYIAWCAIAPCLLLAKNEGELAGKAEVNYNTTKSNMRNDIGAGVHFGSGPTPANKDNYRLESFIPSGSLTITNPEALAETSDGAGRYTYEADYVLRNTTDAEINIYEIGLFAPACSTSSRKTSGTVTFHAVLLERTVLTEPITIAPGESKLVTYKLTFNQTLNVE